MGASDQKARKLATPSDKSWLQSKTLIRVRVATGGISAGNGALELAVPELKIKSLLGVPATPSNQPSLLSL